METQRNNRHAVFGRAVNAAGGRWWVVKERFGLDLTASHEMGSGTVWTIGFGWYGLGI